MSTTTEHCSVKGVPYVLVDKTLQEMHYSERAEKDDACCIDCAGRHDMNLCGELSSCRDGVWQAAG